MWLACGAGDPAAALRMMKGADFESALGEGKRNSLGRTVEVADAVMADKRKLKALFACYGSDDEWVRLRVSNALKRVFRQHPPWIVPWIDPLLDHVLTLQQASAQWTVAQLCLEGEVFLSPEQKRRAIKGLKALLDPAGDWIVQNAVIETLGTWAGEDGRLRRWLIPRLHQAVQGPHKSVAKRAQKKLSLLGDPTPR